MGSNSSPFRTEVKRNFKESDSVESCGKESRLLARAAALRFCGHNEVNLIAVQVVADLALASRDWGQRLPAPVQPWLELFHTRYMLERELRASRIAMSALASRWCSLSVALRQNALGSRSRLGELGLGDALGAVERESLVRFAIDAADVSLLPLVVDGVMDVDSGVAGAAEESLALAAAAMVGANIRELGVKPQSGCELAFSQSDIGWREALHGSLASLCEKYQDHRRRGILGAAVALLTRGTMAYAGNDRGDPLARWLLSGSQDSHPALRSMLRRNVGPLSRLRAWEWLTCEPMVAAALERVAWADSAGEHEAVLCASHLIENPRRAAQAALISVKKFSAAGPIPEVASIPSLSVVARRGLTRLIQGVRATEEQREEWLSPILADPDTATRMSAMQALPARAVIDYCFDEDEGVAEAATLKWSLQSGADAAVRAHVFKSLERSPHASLRWLSLAEQERDRGVSSDLAALAEWKSLREDRAGLIAELRNQIGNGNEAQRLAGVLSAQRLGVQKEVELELLTVLSDPTEPTDGGKLLATVVTALGSSGTDLSLEAVRLCLNHPVARVRSNAVEALARAARGRGDMPFSSPRLYESMIEMKNEGSHRVRATVLREILGAASPQRGGTGYEPVAADGLLAMLGDARATHRLAALWAVERVASQNQVGDSLARRWDAMASRVAELTHDEEDEAVRRRAVRCARRMLARMRAERAIEQEVAA